MRTKYIAIEGADGAGKNTVAKLLAEKLHGHTSKVIAFPRYDETIAGEALGRFLAGLRRSPSNSPQVVATLYALDRFEYKENFVEQVDLDFVIFDRYTASNVAYQCAKSKASDREIMKDWIVDLELSEFGLPKPDLNVFLNTPLTFSKKNIIQKNKRSYTDLTFDLHEQDEQLQIDVIKAYIELSKDLSLGPWLVVDTATESSMRSPEVIVDEILERIRYI
jgi:dTMP kinase